LFFKRRCSRLRFGSSVLKSHSVPQLVLNDLQETDDLELAPLKSSIGGFLTLHSTFNGEIFNWGVAELDNEEQLSGEVGGHVANASSLETDVCVGEKYLVLHLLEFLSNDGTPNGCTRCESYFGDVL
uniref:RCC1 and BTB domain-containing protein 2 n=1 Tax=Schistosoma curassoni TaxID=6186 RepID=A0A183KUU1_9TREM